MRDEPRVGTLVERIRSTVQPLIQARYPDDLVRLAELAVLTDAASEASSPGGLIADLALDPPASTADYAKDPKYGSRDGRAGPLGTRCQGVKARWTA
jgi:hypothetical protein